MSYEMHPHKQTSLNIYLFSVEPKDRPFDKFDLRINAIKVIFYTGLPLFEMLSIAFC